MLADDHRLERLKTREYEGRDSRCAHTVVTAIVNADDLGLSREVNDAIFSLMADGYIRSASILANAPATEDATRKLHYFPSCSFGAHLNFSEFRPLSDVAGLDSLLSPGGSFRGELRPTSVLSRKTVHVMGREWEAQIQKLLSADVRLTHLDSHHHIHTNPFLLCCLRELRVKYGIQRARISRNLFARGQASLMRVGKTAYNAALRMIGGFRVTDGFTDLRTFLEMRPEVILACRTLEIQTHPGNPEYQAETRFCSTDWRTAMPFQIKFGNYGEL